MQLLAIICKECITVKKIGCMTHTIYLVVIPVTNIRATAYSGYSAEG